jgi:hypothetical protein
LSTAAKAPVDLARRTWTAALGLNHGTNVVVRQYITGTNDHETQSKYSVQAPNRIMQVRLQCKAKVYIKVIPMYVLRCIPQALCLISNYNRSKQAVLALTILKQSKNCNQLIFEVCLPAAAVSACERIQPWDVTIFGDQLRCGGLRARTMSPPPKLPTIRHDPQARGSPSPVRRPRQSDFAVRKWGGRHF